MRACSVPPAACSERIHLGRVRPLRVEKATPAKWMMCTWSTASRGFTSCMTSLRIVFRLVGLFRPYMSGLAIAWNVFAATLTPRRRPTYTAPNAPPPRKFSSSSVRSSSSSSGGESRATAGSLLRSCTAWLASIAHGMLGSCVASSGAALRPGRRTPKVRSAKPSARTSLPSGWRQMGHGWLCVWSCRAQASQQSVCSIPHWDGRRPSRAAQSGR
eukprot:scaffold104344_cov61-Phaeocystis_antarctica.AAC.4